MGWRRKLLTVFGFVALVIAGVYVASWLMTSAAEPAAFFQPRPGQNRPLVFAHQGGEDLWPSNTMVAFDGSVALGVDVLDTDMHSTADGVLVLIHDETIDRTSNGTGAVRDLTLAELRTYDFAYNFSLDGGSTFPYRGQGQTIVTLEEWFQAFAPVEGLRFGIEIKQTTAQAATGLCQQITAFDLTDRVLVSSFTQPNMDAFRSACPKVATSATSDEVRNFYLLHRVGLIGLSRPRYESFQVPQRSAGFDILTNGFLGDAARRGIPVVPWTIDDPETMDRLIAADVAGINTNRPDLLLDRIAQQ